LHSSFFSSDFSLHFWTRCSVWRMSSSVAD